MTLFKVTFTDGATIHVVSDHIGQAVKAANTAYASKTGALYLDNQNYVQSVEVIAEAASTVLSKKLVISATPDEACNGSYLKPEASS